MLFKAISNAVNLRMAPSAEGAIIGDLMIGDLIKVDTGKTNHADPYVKGTVQTGINLGRVGNVRRKWIAQVLGTGQEFLFSADDRTSAAAIIASRTQQFDVRYRNLLM